MIIATSGNSLNSLETRLRHQVRREREKGAPAWCVRRGKGLRVTLARYRREWFGNIPKDLVSGILVALALIPEAISFSIIAGVDPKVGLYASFAIAVTLAFAGGRPGMISAATAAMAVLFIDLVKDHGLEYLFAVTILTGLLQIGAGFLRLDRLIRFVSRSVMTGFVNALAILIFMAQISELTNVPQLTYLLVATGLLVIYLLPRITTMIPSPLVSIGLLTTVAIMFNVDVRRVGDMGELPSALPIFIFPDIPWNLETLRIILPTALALTVVGLLESLLTASIIDDMTGTPSDKARESVGQGLGNIAAGSLGGMAGCAMIGQSTINTKAGGRGRLSTFTAGVFLLFLIVVLGDLVRQIPMAALVAVMIMVSVSTFQWGSLKEMRTHPVSASVVMVVTVAIVVWTHNLAMGVLTGMLLSGIIFAWQAAQATHVHAAPDGELAYSVTGPVFFVSADTFVDRFDFTGTPDRVRIDVAGAHFWDVSSVHALDKVILHYRRMGAQVVVEGNDHAGTSLVSQIGMYHRPGALNLDPGH
jgi:SulP family sulfate permease